MEPGQEIIIKDNRTNTKLFGGYIKDVQRKFTTPSKYFESCRAQDYMKLITDVADGVTVDYSAGSLTEKEILTALFAAYCPTITVGSYVIAGNLTAINFQNTSLRRAIDNMAAIEERKWYVDADLQLHYFASTGETAPFGLSDSPDDSTTYGYGNLEYTEDTNGDISGSLRCWQHGLFAGMVVGITNSVLSWSAESYLINEVDIKIVSGDVSNTDIVIEYVINFGTLPRSQITNEIIRGGRVITTARVADAAITTAKIEDLSVTTAKINNLAVTDAKITSLSVDKLTAGSLTVAALLIQGVLYKLQLLAQEYKYYLQGLNGTMLLLKEDKFLMMVQAG
jgi:hypothetical protein